MNLKKMTNGKFQVRWRDDQRKQRARNFRWKADAQDFLRRLQRGDEIRESAEQGELLFSTFAETWLERHAAHELAPTSQLKVARIYRQHLKPLLGGVLLEDLRKSHLLTLRGELKGKGLANKSVNDIEQVGKTMLNLAVDWGYLGVNPWAGMRGLKVPKAAFGFWTAEERDRFLNHCRTKDPAFAELVMVATWTGLRRGELQALQIQQLDFERGQIRVDATYSDHLKKRLERTKNGEVEWVPMARPVLEGLKSRRLGAGSTSPVFCPSLFRDAYWRLKRRSKAAGVKEIRFHDLRHTAASIWVMAGKPLYTVQKLMRHKSVTMTERYAHLSPDYMRDAADLDTCTKSALTPDLRAN